jgi:TetR/AcrR family transcriptional regulator
MKGQVQLELKALQKLRFNPEPSGRGQERGRETMDRIVTAAVELFAEKGFRSTSTHEIAARAKVNQGLITYYFKSKLGLWKAAMDRIFGGFRNTLATRIHELRDVDEGAFFRLMVRHYINWAAENPYIVRLLIDESKSPGERLRWLVARHVRPIHKSLGLFIARAQQHGVVIKAPIVNLVYQFLAGATVFSLPDEVMLVTGKNALSKEFIEAQADMLLAMLSTSGGGRV